MRHARCSTRLHGRHQRSIGQGHLLSLPAERLRRALPGCTAQPALDARAASSGRLAGRRVRRRNCRRRDACATLLRVKGYLEYLELHAYFARPGQPRLSRGEYDALHAEYIALAGKHPALSGDERARLGELKLALFRDKP